MDHSIVVFSLTSIMGKDTNKPVVTKLPLDKALLLINKKITTVPFYNKVHIIKSESQNDDNNSSNDRIPLIR